MSKKDFKQGMVAGAKPFGDKLDQLANVSESAVGDLQEALSDVTEVAYTLVDDVESHDSILSAYEKKRIYDLDDATDVSALDDDEKEFLVVVLTELANAIANVSDLQKKYLLSVCSVANIPAAQSSLNLACIENVENMKTQKILLRHVMEFLFIGDQNYNFLENYEDDLFCYFSVNKRGVAEIKDCINRVYNAMGIEGVANRYTFAANYQEICDEQEVCEDIEEIVEEVLEETINPEDYEKQVLDGLISVQDELVYQYRNLTINATCAVNGNLTLADCVIQLGADASFNVVGSIVFENCVIACASINTKDNFTVVSADGARVEFKNCVFKQLHCFLNATSDVLLEKCTLINCNHFVYAHSYSTKYKLRIVDCNIIADTSLLSNSVATSSELEGLLRVSNSYGMFSISNYEAWEMRNVEVTVSHCGAEKLNLIQVSSYNGKIENSKFNGVVIYTADADIHQCTFENSTIKVGKICNSRISQCEVECDGIIDRCDFSDMAGDMTIEAKGITNCTFNNISCRKKNFITTKSTISNCVFSNVNINSGTYLIEAIVDYGLGDKKQDIQLKNCRFVNCYTDRSDKMIVTGQEIKRGIFSDKTLPYVVACNNCTGLNQIKSGTFEAVQVTQDASSVSMGAKIGAGVGAIVPGIGLIVGGAVGAVVGAVVDGAKKNAVEEAATTIPENLSSTDVAETIRKYVDELFAKNTGFGTPAKKLSVAEKTTLLTQMADDDSLIHNDIIGVYDASIMNSFSGNFNGILFLKDRIYVKLTKSSPKEMMKYADMESIAGSLTKRILTGKNGNEIILNGLNYATDDIYQLFVKIIAIAKEN